MEKEEKSVYGSTNKLLSLNDEDSVQIWDHSFMVYDECNVKSRCRPIIIFWKQNLILSNTWVGGTWNKIPSL